jgi:hypothetical protein
MGGGSPRSNVALYGQLSVETYNNHSTVVLQGQLKFFLAAPALHQVDTGNPL